MKTLNLETWERRDHYNHFKALDYPHFSLCANVDITEFYRFIKENNKPFFVSFLYVSSKVANDIKEFRYRIKGDEVIVHDVVSPAFTIMTSKDVFSFCISAFVYDYNEFTAKTSKKIELSKDIVNVTDEEDKDDVLYITSVPWVSFTNITHPIHMNPADSIPRIAWGKYFEDKGKLKLPLSVQAHHALVDGMHVGQYFSLIQEILDHPEKHL